MLPLRKNPETGFLESMGTCTFDSNKKVEFIRMATEIRSQSKWPDVGKLCEAVGITYTTFRTHLKSDENFRNAWQEIKSVATAALESQMYDYAQRPSGYMHMITWLRKNAPEDWNPELKLNINADSSNVKDALSSAQTVFDAEIVADIPGINSESPANHLRDEGKP